MAEAAAAEVAASLAAALRQREAAAARAAAAAALGTGDARGSRNAFGVLQVDLLRLGLGEEGDEEEEDLPGLRRRGVEEALTDCGAAKFADEIR